MQAQKSRVLSPSKMVTVLLAALLILGAGWTLYSRAPADTRLSGGPPAQPRAGFSAPDFSLETLDGDTLSLADLRGHPVVLNLWASWCPPCRSEMPVLQEAYQQFQGQGLVVLGLNMTSQDSEADARAFVQKLGLTFPIPLDRQGTAASLYRMTALPSTYFIDREGVIQAVVIGGPMQAATIQAHIQDLLEGK
jgi:cytochrome c biogenesis protein CcmG, thiol:disulfide interchange protein DsbE